MTKEDLAAAMAAFEQSGGEVKQVAEGEKSNVIDPRIRNCQCGCKGVYTDHSMRFGEGGWIYDK